MTVPTNSEVQVSVLATYDEFVAIAAEWSELFAVAERPTSFQRHAWLRTSWELAWRRFPNNLRVILVRRDGVLTVAGCFVFGFNRLRPIVRPLTSTLPQPDELLWRPSPHTDADAALLLEALRREAWLPTRMILRVRSDGLLGRSVAARNWPHRVIRRSEEAFVPLDAYANYDTYFASLSQNLKVDHRRRLRRFAEMPGFVHLAEPYNEAKDTVAWLLDTKRAWLARRGRKTAWLKSGLVDRFFARLHQLPGKPEVRVASLRVAGGIVAASLSLIERDWMKFAIVTHDPAFGKHSPGRSLALLEIAAAFARGGIREFDLGVGDLDWKRRLTADSRWTSWERVRL
jgi:CelD/BcsL family acetyltransferase involved in cellulose biosynthesis